MSLKKSDFQAVLESSPNTRQAESFFLEWVHPILLGEGHYIYDIGINPKTGDDVTRCPWLRKTPNQDKFICRIHDVKPEHCRKYPRTMNHAEETGCRGFLFNYFFQKGDC